MKYSDGEWHWDTIEEYYTLVLFDCLNKIHKYNEELQRIYTNAEGHSQSEVDVQVWFLSTRTFEIGKTLEIYSNFIKQKHWPKIIHNESTKWFCVFGNTNHTLV